MRSLHLSKTEQHRHAHRDGVADHKIPPIEEPREVWGFYALYGKRALDIGCSLAGIIGLGWLMAGTAIFVRVKLGSPVVFKQVRPGKVNAETGQETLFEMWKFRTMTDERNASGELLSDEERLTPFGKTLRATSIDELPELFNILKGDMSVVGPRPQLVRDMVFMTPQQRRRHIVKPGLTGLAQIRGRNNLEWKNKLTSDLEYVDNLTLKSDISIVLKTISRVIKKDGTSTDGMETSEDFGDYLLRIGDVSKEEYSWLQSEAKALL